MAATLAHRGPNDEGTWADQAAGIALGFRRLSIVDLSPEGRQPMHSDTGRFVLAFNGEIYNHRAIRDELNDPAPYRGHSDTEVMLRAFERWGVRGSIDRFVGMYAFALWDRKERALYLGRDRLGEKPLYYGWMGKTLLFGSELKALLTHPDFRAGIDRNTLIPYLRHGWIPTPLSIYKGVYKLPQGTTLTFTDPQAPVLPEPEPYWSARQVVEAGAANPFTGTEDEAVDALERLLTDVIRDQMVADVPLGAFLSGGIDSSAIVALMQAQTSRPVKTFTIGFSQPGFDEAPFAGAVAKHLGTDHSELYVTPADTLNVIPKIPSIYDEPFADVSQIPTYLISQLASRHVTVSLSGDGGDELFGGYPWYHRTRSIWRRFGHLPGGLRRSIAWSLSAVPARFWDAALDLLRPTMPGAMRKTVSGDRVHKFAELVDSAESPESVHRQLSSKWSTRTRVVLDAAEPDTLLVDRARWVQVDDLISRIMFMDMATYLPDNHMVKVDRASMAVSLEVRAPLLDHRVAEFACRLPTRLKLRNTTGKYILRQVLYRHVPRNLVERPKMGFPVPIDPWLRGPLRNWAESLLDEGRLRREGFFDPGPIRKKWREHLSGTRNWRWHLWHVLMFQAWLDARTPKQGTG